MIDAEPLSEEEIKVACRDFVRGRALSSEPSPAILSEADLLIACRNIGYDLRCGACAEQFYTGHRGHACSAWCESKR